MDDEIDLYGAEKEEVVKASKELLSSKSRFFSVWFTSQLEKDIGKKEFHLPSIPTETLKQVVEFAVTDSIDFSCMDCDLLDLIKAADFLELLDLQQLAIAELRVLAKPRDFLTILQFGEQCSDEVRSFAVQKILENAEAFFNRPDYLQLTGEQMFQILSSDDLNMPNEERLWKIVRNWYQLSAETRKADFKRLLPLVRFPLMGKRALERILQESTVQRNPMIREALCPLLQEAFKLTDDPEKKFELDHPRYYLRNCGFESGIVVPGYSQQVALLNPATKKMHRFPQLQLGSGCLVDDFCLAQDGSLFVSADVNVPERYTVIFRYDKYGDRWLEVHRTVAMWKHKIQVLGRDLLIVGTPRIPSQWPDRMEVYDMSVDRSRVWETTLSFRYLELFDIKGHLYALKLKDYGPISVQTVSYETGWHLVKKCSSNVARFNFSACKGEKGLIYTFSLCHNRDNDVTAVEVYNPDEDSWMTLANISCRLGGLVVAPLNGRILWCGRRLIQTGGSRFSFLAEFNYFDEETGRHWAESGDAKVVDQIFKDNVAVVPFRVRKGALSVLQKKRPDPEDRDDTP